MNETNKKTFETLNVKPEIVQVLKEEGIIEPTAIQEKTIPIVYAGNDLIGISRTGSGKTASFGIPLLEKVQANGGVQGLILAPTRELANQISGELRKWSKYLNLNVATIFGGVGMDPQIRDMTRSEIVVGTPGRTLDHLERGNLNLSRLTCFVLDEADKMVEMGFIEDIERIISAAPKNRQILLFGATISNEVDYIRNKYMRNVVMAETELQVKKDLLKQSYYNVKPHEKFSLLVYLLKKEEIGRVIIFCSKRSTVELVNKNLRLQGIKTEMIHGKMTQNKRLSVIERFNSGKTDYLVASAVAARGLDIKGITHIFNYDLSQDPQEYVHRVGRTARAGESGEAITLLSDQDHEAFYAIFDRYKIDAEELPMEEFPRLRFETGMQRSNGFNSRNGFNGNGRRNGHRSYNGNYNGRSNDRSSGRPNSRSNSRSNGGLNSGSGYRSNGETNQRSNSSQRRY